MHRIGNPMQIPELDLQPELAGGVELSGDMQQVLSLLTGYWHNKRLLLKSSPSGILFTASPQIKDIFHVTGVGANYAYQGANVECSEILVMGHPNNTGKIWVYPHGTATTSNGWPLDAGDVLNLGITNLIMLNLLIVVDGEKAVIAYTM